MLKKYFLNFTLHQGMVRRRYFSKWGDTQKKRKERKTENRFFNNLFRKASFEGQSNKKYLMRQLLKKVDIYSTDEEIEQIFTEYYNNYYVDGIQYTLWDWD